MQLDAMMFVELLRQERETAERQRVEIENRLRQERETAERQRVEMEAQHQQEVKQHQQEVERHQQEVTRQQDIASAKSCVSDGQLELLQTRLDALHQAKLLTDEEMGILEDWVADYVDCRSALTPTAPELSSAAEKVKKMVGLSETISRDGMLARQLRRKYVT